MKKLFFLLTTVWISLGAYCDNPYKVLDTIIIHNQTLEQVYKSGDVKSMKVDSLLIERWSEDSNQSEYSQLERWTWYDNGLGKSWELFDWDPVSNQWICNDREEYEWDSLGRKTIHVDFDPDSLTYDWVRNARVLYSYDSKGNVLNSLLQSYHQNTRDWSDSLRQESSYNESGQLTVVLESKWDSDNQEWLMLSKSENSYDDVGRLLRSEVFDWLDIPERWESQMYVQNEYDENGFLSLEEIVMTQFFLKCRFVYTNDENGNALQTIGWAWSFATDCYQKILKYEKTFTSFNQTETWESLSWNATKDDWESNWIRNYTYNSDENLTFDEAFLWDNDSSCFVNHLQYHYAYDKFQNNSSTGKYLWDEDKEEWIAEYRDLFIYDDNGNFLSTLRQVYDPVAIQWIDFSASENEYDQDVLFANVCFPTVFSFGHLSNVRRLTQYTNALVRRATYETIDGQYRNTSVFRFYYSEKGALSSSVFSKKEIKIYPNPTREFVVFDGIDPDDVYSVEIYDLQGRKVLFESQCNGHKLHLPRLESGTYFYILRQNADILRGKILINAN